MQKSPSSTSPSSPHSIEMKRKAKGGKQYTHLVDEKDSDSTDRIDEKEEKVESTRWHEGHHQDDDEHQHFHHLTFPNSLADIETDDAEFVDSTESILYLYLYSTIFSYTCFLCFFTLVSLSLLLNTHTHTPLSPLFTFTSFFSLPRLLSFSYSTLLSFSFPFPSFLWLLLYIARPTKFVLSSFEQLPRFLADNEFIRYGYRVHFSFKLCLISLFKLHNGLFLFSLTFILFYFLIF